MHPLILRIKKILFSSGFEPETFRVLGGCDNQLHHENAGVNVKHFDVQYSASNHLVG